MHNKQLTMYKKILPLLFIVYCLLFVNAASLEAAEEGTIWWGSDNVGSAGGSDTVPEGYGLTAIGYGSDDKNCTIQIKTAPVNFIDGTVDFANTDTSWRVVNCGTPGDDTPTPQISNAGSTNMVPYNHIITGWSWGANTSGGIIGNDGSPADECAYQEYMNLKTGQYYAWGSQYDGSCNERGYRPYNARMTVRAPAGRVITAIGLSLGNDANVSWLGVTTREVVPPKTAGLAVSTSQVDLTPNNNSQTVTISNISATNGGIFTVDCVYQEQTLSPLSPNNVSIQCPSGQNITNTASLPVSVIGSLPPGTYTGKIDIVATGVDGTTVSPDSQSVEVNYTVGDTPPPSPPPPPPPPAPGEAACTLTADGLTNNKTIASGGTVTWKAATEPSGLTYFWHVSGPVARNDVQGEGSTPDTRTYSYNTPGTYEVYFHASKDGSHNICSGGKSNTVTLTVNDLPNAGINLTASPSSIKSGESSTLSWSISDNRNWPCALGTWNGSSFTSIQSIPSNAPSGSRSTGALNSSATYRVQCPYPDTGSFSYRQADVTVDGGVVQETSDTNHLTAATDGRIASSQYQCGTEEVENCENRYYACDPPSYFGCMVNRPYCYETTEPIYCASYSVAGSWQDPLSGASPLRDVDLKFTFRGTPSVYADKVEFDCTNDGKFDKDISTRDSQTSDILAQNLCTYNSPGTYTARARGLDSHGKVAWCYDHSCEDTSTIIVGEPPVDVSLSSNWNIPSAEASSPSMFQSKWDYDNDNLMTSSDATILAQVAGRTRSCPSGKDCDFNGNGSVNIGDSLAYSNYLKNPIKVQTGSSLGGVITLTSKEGGNVTLASSPSGYTISPNPVTVLKESTPAYASFIAPSSLSAGNYTLTFSTTGSNSSSNALNFEVLAPVAQFDYTLSNSGTSNVTKTSGNAFTTNTITKTKTAGNTEAVTLVASGVPTGVTYSISNSNCSPNCTSVIIFTVPSNTPTGTYQITVTGSPLGKQTRFNLVVSGNPVTVTCSVSPTNPLPVIGQTVTWTASIPSGGTPPFTYSWTGTNIPSNPAPTGNPYRISYSTVGSKTASVTVTDADSLPSSCQPVSIQVNFSPTFEEF